MQGIQVLNLENIVKNADKLNVSINSSIDGILKNFLLVENTVSGDLAFLTNGIGQELKNLNIIFSNNVTFNDVLKEVIKSYQSQSTRLYQAIKEKTPQDKPKIEGRDKNGWFYRL